MHCLYHLIYSQVCVFIHNRGKLSSALTQPPCRDLLQRHYSTYHEVRDPANPLPSGALTAPGRTPIACQNCANAKTGCDKQVPCTRCQEKKLACEARFARRTSKAARAARLPTLPQQPADTITPALMDMRNLHNQASPVTSSPGLDISGTIDPRIHDALQHNKSSSGLNADGFPSPSIDIPTPMDGLMQMNNEMVANDPAYAWAEAGLAPFDNLFFGTSFTFDHNDLSMPSLGSISDISTASEPMMASSSRGSIDRTNDTSMAASLNNDPGPYKMIDMSLIVEAENSVAEFSAVIAAEAAWPMARCSQPMYSGRCPRTAIVHLEALESKLREEGTWTALQSYLDRAALEGDSNVLPQVKPLSANSREQMLAITQSFLHKALEIHRGGFSMYAKTNLMQHGPFPFNFIVLPPSNIVEYFLGSYVRSLTVYFSLVQCHIIDPNEMLYNTQASTLLVLLMIAQGAAAVPMAEARFLSGGLIETCRISLFDIIERDVELSADPIVLRCALLFTLLGAWSGDAWLMNIAMGQRGMYLSVSTAHNR